MPPEQEEEDPITPLKRKKRILKTQLTKNKLLLTSYLCASEKDSDQIRTSVDTVLRAQEEVIDILLQLYDLNEDFEQELDFIQSDPNTADLLSKATSYFAISNVATSQEVINPEPTPEQINTSTNEDGNENPTDAVPTSDGAGMVSPPTPSPNSHLLQLNYDMVQQLHRVSIPKFNGNKREYPLFRDAFMECVDKTLTSKSYKMLQLRQHLEQDALNAIEGFPASDIGYDSAIGRLDEKYGGPRRAVLIHLDAIRQMKGVNFNDLKTLEKFVDKLELCIISLKENGRKEEFEANSMFFCVARSKVPPDNVTQFKRWAAMQNFDETLVNLHTWLANEVRYRVEAREEVDGFNYGSASSSSSSSKYKYKYPHSDHRTKTYATNTNTQCPICNTAHSTGIVNCPVFRSFGIHDRWSVARDRRLCYRCLSPNHQGYKCNSSQRCWINGCPKSHHFLLHGGGSEDPALNSCQPRNYERYEQRPNEATSLKQPVDYRSKHESRTHTQTNNCDCIAMRIAPVILCNGNRKRHANALLDECSSDTYIDDLLAADLGLVGIPISLNVGVVGGSKKLLHTTEVTINLSSYDYSTNLIINAFTVRDVTGDMTAYDWSANCHNWPHLKDIPFPRVVAGTKVDLLIGLNALELHRSITEIGGQIGEPVARLTPLGWTCMGPIPVQQRTQSGCGYSFARAFFIRETDSVDDILRNMWEVESGGLSGKLQFSPSEKQAMETTNNSLCQVDNRYRVGIPWKPGEPNLPNNYSVAESRLLNLEKSLSRRPTVAREYRKIIDDQIRKGYISEVTKDPYNPDSYFLPHFAVVRWDKLTTKVRVVMDGAARCQGKSLNDCINPGPKLQRDLFDVLLRFRSNQIALVADITEMFLQIEIEPKDRQYHRFLWRDLDFQSPIKIYEYKRLVFGNSSSPYLSQAVIREHCLSNIDKYPIGANSILNSMYIDDLLDSVNDTSKAIQLRREISSLLMDAGFAIRKWLSNDPKVLEDIPVCDRVNQFAFDDDSLPSVKTLGVLWKADSDLFTFQVQRPEAVILTKRLVVSRASTLFDPLSFLSPFTVRAKIGIQKTWIQGLHWDDELPDDLIKPWEKWFEELPELSQVKVQRCLLKTDSKVKSKSIHTFVDASELALASACYLRSEYEDGSVSVILVVAKTRVAPLKTISIPKLELCGAILGVRLTKTVCEVLNISKSNITYWCDSQNVLYWLKGQSRNYKPFVSHRVGEIHENSDPNQWRWIPTKLNSADLATRGISVSELVASDLWWHGPEFLLLENEHWPQSIISDPPEALEEERSNRTATFVTNPVIKELGRLNPSRYSSWTKLLRISAWVFRFINNCRTPQQRNNSPTLESNELHNSETFWIMHAQQEVFADDINELMKNNRVRNDSKLLCLNPCLDESGILRVKGRLDSAEHLSYETRHPVILPSKHDITRLIVKLYHDRGNHETGVSYVLSELRSRYWIIRGREVVKSVRASCNECKRRRNKPAQQIMAPLPKMRLGMPLRAFSRVGLDYGGPYLTKHGRGRVHTKRYLCLFTCLASRAVHLEMAWGLDTDSFLSAFSRFVSRRGKPIQVLSDNGSNFVGADRELKELLNQLDQNRIGNSLANREIKWTFNPPLSPHFGGVFESMIKSAKRAIKAVVGNADVTDEELETAFVNTEGLLNSRPLGYQGDDPQDDPVLTPNHFLHGQVGGQFAPESVDEIPFNPRNRWRRVQDLVRQFWQRWLKEILPTLNSRKKWNIDHKDLSEGDIVIVIDPQTPRGKWPLGRIVQIYPGSDDHVRVVDVKIGNKILKRSIHHLCPLEC